MVRSVFVVLYDVSLVTYIKLIAIIPLLTSCEIRKIRKNPLSYSSNILEGLEILENRNHIGDCCLACKKSCNLHSDYNLTVYFRRYKTLEFGVLHTYVTVSVCHMAIALDLSCIVQWLVKKKKKYLFVIWICH